MKTYEGERPTPRHPDGCKVVVVLDGRRRDLNPRFDIRNHSPTGFEWGYSGSGPAQLALAICADALGDDARARAVYQDFKSEVISGLRGSRWTMDAKFVREVVEEIEKRRAA